MTLFTAKKNRQADKDGKQTPPVKARRKLSRAEKKQIEACLLYTSITSGGCAVRPLPCRDGVRIDTAKHADRNG